MKPNDKTGRIIEAAPIKKKKHVEKRPVDSHKYVNEENDDSHKKAKLARFEKRKARARSIGMGLFTTVVMIITMVIILNIMNRSDVGPQFMFIQKGVLEHNITTQALIIRNEIVLPATESGYIKPLIQSGSRVSFGQTIAAITKEGSEEALATLLNYDLQISEIQLKLVMEGKGSGATAIYEEADESIQSLIDEIRRDSAANVFDNMNSFRTSIEIAMNHRDSRLLGIDFQDETLDELKRQKNELKDALGIITGKITAPNPGIVSYSIDGLEGVLTIEAANTMSLSEFNSYFDSEAKDFVTGDYIEKDQSAVKVITGLYQYIALLLDESSDSAFPLDSIANIGVTGMGIDFENCTVSRKLIQDGKLLVVFKTDRNVVRFSGLRTFRAVVCTKKTSGYKIPNTAMVDVSQDFKTAKIMLVVNGYVRSLAINIVDHDSEFSIIEVVNEDDEQTLKNGYLVKNPSSVSEGENIGE